MADHVLSEPHRLQCMEIWGGSEAIDSAISIHGMDAWIVSQPYAGDRSGGDIHYVSTCGGGKIGRFVIADVSGHGAEVSSLSSKLRTLMRKHINRLDQTKMVQALNHDFGDLAAEGKFASMILASYFAPTDHIVLVNAGHPPPLWYRSQSQTWQLLEPTAQACVNRVANLPLGIIDSTEYEQFAVKLAPNDLLVVYTDAIIEAQDSDGQLLGTEGLLALARHIEADQPDRFCDRLIDRITEFRGNEQWDDDLTVMVLHHNAADPPRQSLGEMARVLGKMAGLVPV